LPEAFKKWDLLNIKDSQIDISASISASEVPLVLPKLRIFATR
jgi:hypothetical protein